MPQRPGAGPDGPARIPDGACGAFVNDLVPALLAGLAAAVACGPAPARSRLAVLLPPRRAAERAAARHLLSGPVGACVLGGSALALVLGGPAGAVLGLLLALGGPHLLGRLEPRAVRVERERLAADLPLALDLLAACLLGGAPLPAAVGAVSEAVPGPCGVRLARVCSALQVGTAPGDAWHALTDGLDDELASAAVRVMVRADGGGTPVAGAVARLAVEAREGARARGQEAAERAGVLAVGPLGLCFLPAFVALGIVPVVAGLVGPLLAGW